MRGQPSVQFDLAPASVLASFRGAEIEEIGNERLLRLECPVADQCHHAGVGFVYFRAEIPRSHPGLSMGAHGPDISPGEASENRAVRPLLGDH